MLRHFVADLHIHSVLSPCADYHMVPPLIIERAVRAGLDLVAVTDHNSGENAAALVKAAVNSGVAVLPGMEVESREGVHIVTLFDDVEALEHWQGVVYSALPQKENVEKLLGVQLVVDSNGDLIRVNKRLLLTAVDLSLEEIVATANDLGGLCAPAHVDRPAYGLLSVLGLLPTDVDLPALEISPHVTPSEAIRQFPGLAGCTLIRSSDAHSLEDIGKVATSFLIARPTVAELTLACRGRRGRRVII